MKTCKGCNIEFEPNNPRQKFHSNKCCKDHYKPFVVDKGSHLFKTLVVVSIRKCLSCDKNFRSEGKWNRICWRCKDNLAFQSAIMNY